MYNTFMYGIVGDLDSSHLYHVVEGGPRVPSPWCGTCKSSAQEQKDLTPHEIPAPKAWTLSTDAPASLGVVLNIHERFVGGSTIGECVHNYTCPDVLQRSPIVVLCSPEHAVRFVYEGNTDMCAHHDQLLHCTRMYTRGWPISYSVASLCSTSCFL